MHIVLGASGHLGSAVVRALLASGEAVTAVVHHESTSPRLRERGADVLVADIADVEALRAVFAHGRCAFVLNPPADPSTDTDSVERATARAIVRALDGSGLEKVVAASTYGAQPGERIGDLSVLYEFEVQLKAGAIPAAIDRGAYYFSNWDTSIDSARSDGVVQSMLPADLQLPMVAPSDLGLIAARRMPRRSTTPASSTSKGLADTRRTTSPPPSPLRWTATSASMSCHRHSGETRSARWASPTPTATATPE